MMIVEIVKFPASYPVVFLIVSIVWSVYQAYVGYWYGLYIYDNAYNKDTKPTRQPHVRLLAYGLHHGAFYCLCSFSGFAAWCLAHWVSKSITNWSGVTSGTGAILTALAVLSVLGVSGALPRILYLGNRPA